MATLVRTKMTAEEIVESRRQTQKRYTDKQKQNAQDCATEVYNLTQQIRDLYGLLAGRDARIRQLQEQTNLASQREAQVNELQTQLQTQTNLASQREAQVNELQQTLTQCQTNFQGSLELNSKCQTNLQNCLSQPGTPTVVQPATPQQTIYIQPVTPQQPIYIQPVTPQQPIYIQPADALSNFVCRHRTTHNITDDQARELMQILQRFIPPYRIIRDTKDTRIRTDYNKLNRNFGIGTTDLIRAGLV